MGKEKPAWLQQVREFCRTAGIEICGWGSDTLVVETKSPDRAEQITSQLRAFGFDLVENDADSGTLLLSLNPAATRAKEKECSASFDLSRRLMRERIVPVFEALLGICLFWYSVTTPPPKSERFTALAWLILIVFLVDAGRLWGWALRMSPAELQVRRYFRWSAIPWTQIRGVELTSGRSPYQQGVTLALAPDGKLRLGAFAYPFARALRDRLRQEIAKQQAESK